MPRLQILHHKSYHPYNEKNKQRVREDEAKAQAEEEERERQRIDKDSSARLDALRRRAGSPTFAQVEEDAGDLPSTSSTKQDGIGGGLLERHRKAKLKAEKEEKKRKDRLDFEFPSETARKERARLEKYGPDPVEGLEGSDADKGREIKWESGGHLNLFADLEEREANGEGALAGPSMGELAKKANASSSTAKPDPFTLYLGRPDKETKPWYTDRELKRVDEKETGEEAEIRRARDKRKDERSKSRNDPLTQVNSMLSKHPSTKRSSGHGHNHHNAATPRSLQEARQVRESGERQRALALIAQRKNGGMAHNWDDTPSSAAGWAERNEREKDRAGHRFFGGGTSADAPRRYGRSWDI